jgi:TatD DNase family protein
MLVDSHCHLNYDGLSDDVQSVIERAEASGVEFLVCICTKLEDVSEICEIAESYDNVAFTVGVHPHEASKEVDLNVQTIVDLSKHPKVVGIGETGLDFFYDNAPRDIQEIYFRAHIRASRETQLPIIVHSRDADELMIKIISEEQEKGHFPGVIHCFSSSLEVAEVAVKYDMAISLSGIITFKKADKLREIVKLIPIENIIIETDSPFLAPVPKRGKVNEPSYIVHTAEKAAEIFNLELSHFNKITTNNFYRYFDKAKNIKMTSK